MAGLGRKVFNSGDVLTAAQVQGYLADQAIMVFASSTARGTALTSPSEGMFAYLNDSNSLTFYDGAAWQTYPSSLTNTVITNGTVVSSIYTGGTATNLGLVAPEELATISATASAGTVALNTGTTGITYYTTAATGNWTINLRADGTATLNSILLVGQAITHTFLSTQAGTAYFPIATQVDGTAVTPVWQGGGTPTSGNTSSTDVYTYTVLKTSSTPSYLVLASQTQFKA